MAPRGTSSTSPRPLFKGLSLATLGYKAGNPDFPDQTTADQFFDDAQFEAYRQLGYSVGEAVMADNECCGILSRRVGLAQRPAHDRQPV